MRSECVSKGFPAPSPVRELFTLTFFSAVSFTFPPSAPQPGLTVTDFRPAVPGYKVEKKAEADE
jgi:hypothetical protein